MSFCHVTTFADNDYAWRIKGQLVAIDPVLFTLFNANVIRFKATRVVTLAILGVDWEENLSLGSENSREKAEGWC